MKIYIWKREMNKMRIHVAKYHEENIAEESRKIE